MTTPTTTADLNAMSVEDLTTLYNGKAKKPVKKFRTKEAAVKRVRALLGIKGPGRAPSLLNYPCRKDPKELREGTMRDSIAKMLGRGATLEEINAEVGEGKWSTRHTREHVLLIHTHNGFGLEENETSHKIRIIRPS